MRNRKLSKVLVMLIVAAIFSVTVVSLNATKVHAQEVTLEDVLAEIDALAERLEDIETATTILNSTMNSFSTSLDNLQSQLDFLSTTTPTTTELAILDSALDELRTDIKNLNSVLSSLNATATSKSDLTALDATVEGLRTRIEELTTILDEVKADLASFSNTVVTPSELDTTKRDLSREIDSLKTLAIVVFMVALIVIAMLTIVIFFVLRSVKR
jgi:chromosome segregation ATPase